MQARPYLERDAGELDTIARDGFHAGPVLVNVERVGVAVADEVFKSDVGYGAGTCSESVLELYSGTRGVSPTAIALDHQHLVAGPRVDVLVDDVGDVSILSLIHI